MLLQECYCCLICFFFCYEIKVFPVAIVEAIIMFVIYMVLGCKGYSIYGEWQEMHGFYESATSFFGGNMDVFIFFYSYNIGLP